MPANDYHFITHWRVEGTVEEVAGILTDTPALVRWWPSVYLGVRELAPGGEDGVGREVDLYTKGWLPYTLRWQFRVTESHYPHGFALAATGDFAGRGVWTLAQDGPWTNVTYDWRISADKRILRWGSPFLKPIFAANHRWAMARGEESLRLELARRHAPSPAARARIPAPPGPTTNSPVPLLGAGALATLVVSFCLRRAKSGAAGNDIRHASRRQRPRYCRTRQHVVCSGGSGDHLQVLARMMRR